MLGHAYSISFHATLIRCMNKSFFFHYRVGDGTVPLAIVVYINGSFVKHKIPVKPIYVTVHNLSSVVSSKACAWRVLAPTAGHDAQPEEQRSTGSD
jgi:hypothetical protein